MQAVLTALLVSMIQSPQQAAGCPDQPAARVEFVVLRGAIAVSDSLSLDEIRTLYAANGAQTPHKPLGFYVSTFYYRIETDTGEPTPCPGQVNVRVNLVLDARQIVLGREVMAVPCMRNAAANHYRQHARANVRAVTNLSERLKTIMSDTNRIRALQQAGASGPDIERLLRPILEGELPVFDAESRELQSAVDTPAEIKKLEYACSTPI